MFREILGVADDPPARRRWFHDDYFDLFVWQTKGEITLFQLCYGIGTNERAIITGVILEDEKVMGTIHIAFGDNKSMGGSVRVASHLDGLVTRPSVWFDDRPIMKDGRLLVD